MDETQKHTTPITEQKQDEMIKKKRKRDNQIKYLTQEELQRFFKAIEKTGGKFWLRDLVAFQLIYYCGLRASELEYITKESYKPDTNEIHIKRLKGSMCNTIRIIHQDKIKNLNKYIKEYTGDKLYQINQSNTPLFKSKNGEPLRLESIRYLMKYY